MFLLTKFNTISPERIASYSISRAAQQTQLSLSKLPGPHLFHSSVTARPHSVAAGPVLHGEGRAGGPLLTGGRYSAIHRTRSRAAHCSCRDVRAVMSRWSLPRFWSLYRLYARVAFPIVLFSYCITVGGATAPLTLAFATPTS